MTNNSRQIHAKLKGLYSADADDLETFWPPDPTDFALSIQAFVGIADEPGEDTFEFTVCTPRWLERELASLGALWSRHYLFVAEYDFPTIKAKIERLCDRTFGKDWDEVAELLGRYAHWEFEDYQAKPPPGLD